MTVTEAEPFKVGEWLVEPELLRISKNGDVRKLEFRTMEILLCLVSNQGDVVSKTKLHDEVWKEVYVTDNAMTRTVSKLRKAFDDDPLEAKYIDTISKSGYILVAPVEFNPDIEAAPTSMLNRIAGRRWVWGLVVVLVAAGIVLMGISSRDTYSAFFDPIPVSTMVGPELGHAISPDGEKISFSYSEPGANNSDVYVKLLEDLSQVKFTNLESHQGYGIWSPDGNYMAYVSVEDGTCGIYKEPGFGGEKIRIGDCFSRPEDFVWSPDGKTIAFTDVKDPQDSRRIFFLDLETQVAEELLTPDEGTTHRDPAFSSDGKYLIFRIAVSGQGADIFKMRLSDKSITQLTFDKARIFGLDVFDDDKQIVFSSNRGGQWALWKMPFSGGAVSRFYINDRILLEPRFSANDKRMIYKSVTDQTQLWAVTRDGEEFGVPSHVAGSTRTDMHPSISPDKEKVVFLSNRSGHFEIWVSDLKDNSQTMLTSFEGSFVNMPSWSPDGTEVVFDARVDGNNGIYIIDVASKMMRTFSDLDGDQVNGHYSGDGRHIYFASNHTGSWQIWKKSVFDPQAESIRITKNGGFNMQEGPGDGYLYFARTDTLGVWRMEEGKEGSEELFISGLSTFDWGNWIPVNDGIIYVSRSTGPKVYHQSYDLEVPARLILASAKRVQFSTPAITASAEGDKIILAQIEKSEDELMMVDFR